jgi:hypothetical protein
MAGCHASEVMSLLWNEVPMTSFCGGVVLDPRRWNLEWSMLTASRCEVDAPEVGTPVGADGASCHRLVVDILAAWMPLWWVMNTLFPCCEAWTLLLQGWQWWLIGVITRCEWDVTLFPEVMLLPVGSVLSAVVDHLQTDVSVESLTSMWSPPHAVISRSEWNWHMLPCCRRWFFVAPCC